MEVKKFSVICLILASAAFTSAKSASFYYRTGRELEIPVENEIREEIVAELKKDPEIIAIETEPIAKEEIAKDEVIVPVEQLRVAAPVVAVQEPVAVFSEREESNAVVEEAVAVRSAAPETIIPVVVEEKIVSVPIVEEPVAVVAVDEPIPQSRNEPSVKADEKAVEPVVADVQTEVKETPVEVVHVAVKSSPVEEAVVVEKENVAVAETPVAESDEAIRQSEGAGNPTPTSRPSVIQVITNQIQHFQNQIQSVLNPNAANSANADSATPTTGRPTIIAQFQETIGNVFNRPAGSTGPVQAFLQNAQTSFQGLFRPQAAAAASPPATVPVVVAPADPVEEKTMLDEVPVVNQPAEVVEKVEEGNKVEVKSD